MENLEKFEATNKFLIFSIFVPTASVWTIYSLPMLVSAFSVGQICKNDTDCVTDPGTLIYDFNLNDNHTELADLSTSAFMFGNIIGAILIPRIADIKGRRPLLIFGVFMLGLLGCVAAFALNIYMFIIVRLCQGVFFPANGIISFVLAYESLPRKLRNYAPLVFGVFWAIGYCVVTPIAYLLPYWRHLMLACSVPPILAAFVYWLVVPESFHFMMSKRMEPELNKWLKKANKPHVIVSLNAKTLIAEHIRTSVQDEHRDQSFLAHFWAHKKLLVYVAIFSYLWLTDTFVYYDISLYSSDLAGSKYVNYMLAGLIEVPSYLISPYLLEKLGRRLFLSFCHFIAAFSFLFIIFVENPKIHLFLWLIAKFAVSCAFINIFVYASEIFPTVMRSYCIGTCEILARIGGTAVPVVHTLGTTYANLPTIFVTIAAAIAAALNLILPETRGKNLPDTTAEAAGLESHPSTSF